MTIQLTKKTTISETLDIRYPSFYQNGTYHLGFFDVDTVIKCLDLGDYTSIQIGSAEFFSSEIIEAHLSWNEIGEDAFRIELGKAFEKFMVPKKQIITSDFGNDELDAFH